jgi:hypothetical protein
MKMHMKKTLSILVMLTLFSSVVFAGGIGDDPKYPGKKGLAVVKQGSVFKLFYKCQESSDVKVTIYNSNNKTIFKETLHDIDGFMRPYNLEKLAEGDYTVVVTDDHCDHTEILHHFAQKSKSLIGVIQLSETPEKFVLTVGKKLSPETIGVRIFNDKNEIVYEQLEHIEGDFAKLYNLKEGDSYRFEITDSNGTTSIIKNRSFLTASK